MDDDLFAAVIEWREARKAFFTATQPAGTVERFPMDVWTRLGKAENRLMELASRLEGV
jgi:hypothetical protein